MTIPDDDPFPGSFQFWNAIAKAHEYEQLQFTERIGVDVPAGNANYWMWLIPSVGQPPVKSFVLLNTLFVLLIGPICYWFLRKRHRLYFLYFVAPCLAMVVTASLFAYAIGSDGTTTKVRSRQLTWIDADNGFHVQQSRQTYYAVLGSGGGISVPDTTAVFPIRNTPAYNRYRRRHDRSGRQGILTAKDGSDVFSGTFLPPRNQVQYLNIRPIRDRSQIQFQFDAAGASVRNGYEGGALDAVIVSDSNGKMWQAESVGIGETVDLKPANADALASILNTEVVPTLGEVPMLRDNVSSLGGGMGGLQVSVLEKKLDAWSRNLPPSCFVARTAVEPDRVGLQDVRILDSVHVIMGEVD